MKNQTQLLLAEVSEYILCSEYQITEFEDEADSRGQWR